MKPILENRMIPINGKIHAPSFFMIHLKVSYVQKTIKKNYLYLFEAFASDSHLLRQRARHGNRLFSYLASLGFLLFAQPSTNKFGLAFAHSSVWLTLLLLSIWLSVDPMSDKYPSLSPYVYCANNPIKLVDPNGEEIGDFYNLYGDYIGTDGKNDGKVYLVRDGASEIYIKENHRNKNIKYTNANDNNISIAFETTYEDIQQALVVYKKEGKNEEGGAFDNEGKWHDGKGYKDHVELPISVGRTSIHRHPWDRGNDYSKIYSTPEKASEGDLQSFTGFQQNIIVGKRMGNFDAFQGSTNRQPIMSFYGNDGVQDTPRCSITIIAAEKIINHRR